MRVSKELGDQSKAALAWKKSDVLTIKLPFKRNGIDTQKKISQYSLSNRKRNRSLLSLAFTFLIHKVSNNFPIKICPKIDHYDV